MDTISLNNGYSPVRCLQVYTQEKIKWNITKDKKTLKQLRELPSEPVDPDQIKVKVIAPYVVKGRRKKGILLSREYTNFQYFMEAGKPKVRVEIDALAKLLEIKGIKESWTITIEIIYPEK